MKKLTKTQVKALFKKNMNQTVLLFPSKCGPANTVWVKGCEYNPSSYPIQFKEVNEHFDRFVNEFKYYNCIPELGRSVHFYAEV